MNHSLGVEIEATATWLDEHGASGAATLLRRIARQRDEARRKSTVEPSTRAIPIDLELKARGLGEERRRLAEEARRQEEANAELRRDNAMLRTDLARFQALAERAGWVPDAGRRLWRWREGWWELGYRKKNSKDGYHDTGWYLWGPDGSFGEWIASHKADAMTEANRLITKHLAATAEVKP
ncbi:hypothetical protein [Streptomyces sp. NPDC058989]|uniref:hypothetical protein n=1 Tax=Streptomyces sp. NPDC058989 TaxID=3346686 RepID=UPI0036A927EE